MQKFVIHVSKEISFYSKTMNPPDERYLSTLMDIGRGVSCGSQVFTESEVGVVGKSVVHTSAMKQVTGEAVYVDDMPKLANELYAVVVQSTEAHANILNVDYSEAVAVAGVVDYVSWKDIPNFDVSMPMDEKNPNVIGPVFRGTWRTVLTCR